MLIKFYLLQAPNKILRRLSKNAVGDDIVDHLQHSNSNPEPLVDCLSESSSSSSHESSSSSSSSSDYSVCDGDYSSRHTSSSNESEEEHFYEEIDASSESSGESPNDSDYLRPRNKSYFVLRQKNNSSSIDDDISKNIKDKKEPTHNYLELFPEMNDVRRSSLCLPVIPRIPGNKLKAPPDNKKKHSRKNILKKLCPNNNLSEANSKLSHLYYDWKRVTKLKRRKSRTKRKVNIISDNNSRNRSNCRRKRKRLKLKRKSEMNASKILCKNDTAAKNTVPKYLSNKVFHKVLLKSKTPIGDDILNVAGSGLHPKPTMPL